MRPAWPSYAFKIFRRDNTRSIKARMPRLLEMASDSSSRVMAFSLSSSIAYGRFGKTGAPSAGLVSVAISVQLIIV